MVLGGSEASEFMEICKIYQESVWNLNFYKKSAEFPKKSEKWSKKCGPRGPKGRPRGLKSATTVIDGDPGVVLLEANPPQRIKILGLQDWKYWKIGKTARIGKKNWKKGLEKRIGRLDAQDLTRRGARRIPYGIQMGTHTQRVIGKQGLRVQHHDLA